VRFAAGAAGVRYKGRTDVMLALLDEGTRVAGVFTKSKCPSAPVDWCRARLEGGKARALLVNSGNANAFTARPARRRQALGQTGGCGYGCARAPDFPRLHGRHRRAARRLEIRGRAAKLVKKASPDAWLDAARAIMTTDTYPNSRPAPP